MSQTAIKIKTVSGPSFTGCLDRHGLGPLRRERLRELQVNPHFRRFVDGLLTLGAQVTSRCNLTVLLESGQEDLASWYAQREIRLVCSLPCYTQKNVDAQRGDGA